MSIANPIYDVIFKYLLDDDKIARMLLSALLGKEVLELTFVPTETRGNVSYPDGPTLLVLRMDFAATVKLEDGSRKLVLIEIQKARDTSDIHRFRRYLGTAYASTQNVYRDLDGVERPLPILTIYFLGEGLKGVDVPVIKINRHYEDAATGAEVLITDPFVEALTHNSIVIQMDRLKDRRRTDLERLLAVFDQGLASHTDPHFLEILEVNFPEHYKAVLRRLTLAFADSHLRKKMELEDEILRFLQDKDRKADDLRQALSEKDKALNEKDKALNEKDKALNEKDKAIDEKDRLIAELTRRLGPP
jgi:hypothetical protein